MIAWQDILNYSDLLASQSEVEKSLHALVEILNDHYYDKNPIVVCLMNGGLFFTSQLCQLLRFPLRIDYMHATRYRDKMSGEDLQWVKSPQFNLANEHVLLIDDIFDEGITLKEVTEKLLLDKPASLESVVLIEKVHCRKPDDFSVKYVGMRLEDRYLYGMGMDYLGHWRHLPHIYAVQNGEKK